ncbi:hypothetical protein IKA15_04695 [bacterium]|nr:hypothetical protein [bacterium]
MGFSADQTMVLISKSTMNGLESRRADINNEKLAVMRELETASMKYSEATTNTCFMSKNEQTGEYEDIKPVVNSSYTKIADVTGDQNYLQGYTFNTKDKNGNSTLTQDQIKSLAKNNGAASFTNYYKNGQIEVKDKNGKQVSLEQIPGIVEGYYTADDAAAEAEYNALKSKLEAKETKLDMSLEQVETQYQAVKTQYESARQLVNQRAQGDFKFFQG